MLVVTLALIDCSVDLETDRERDNDDDGPPASVAALMRSAKDTSSGSAEPRSKIDRETSTVLETGQSSGTTPKRIRRTESKCSHETGGTDETETESPTSLETSSR